MKNLLRYSMAATILAVGMVISSALISKFFVRVKQEKEITVKGFATAPITSDRGKLRFVVFVRRDGREEAYKVLTKQVDQVIEKVRESAPADLLIERDLPDITVRKKLNEKGNRTHEIESYGADQTVTLTSSDVSWVKRAGPELNKLIGEGYDIRVQSPSFLVSDLSRIKQDLLQKATADGLRRAQLMAHNSGAEVGPLRAARQGVFQITEPNSIRTSSYGVYDTSTIEKSIKAVVTLEYSVV